MFPDSYSAKAGRRYEVFFNYRSNFRNSCIVTIVLTQANDMVVFCFSEQADDSIHVDGVMSPKVFVFIMKPIPYNNSIRSSSIFVLDDEIDGVSGSAS